MATTRPSAPNTMPTIVFTPRDESLLLLGAAIAASVDELEAPCVALGLALVVNGILRLVLLRDVAVSLEVWVRIGDVEDVRCEEVVAATILR